MKDISPGHPLAFVATARAQFLARRPALEMALGLLLFELAFYLAYRSGMQFSQTLASPFWIPDSILLCALLRSRPKNWWLFVLAPLPIRLFVPEAHGLPLWFLFGCFAVDSAKGVLAAALLRRIVANPIRFQTPAEFGWFGLIAALLVPAGAAFFGAWLRSRLGDDYWHVWQQWFLGDAVSQLVVTPAILYWVLRSPPNLAGLTRARLLEAVTLTAALIVTSYLAFDSHVGTLDLAASRQFLPIPFLFWAAIRFGMAGASAGVPVIAFFAVQAALARRGVFADYASDRIGLALQDFLIIRAVPVYLVAALVEQWDTLGRQLRDSEARFRTMANAAPMLLWTAGLDRRTDFVNDGWLRFTGRTLEQELAEGWKDSLHPDDIERCNKVFATAYETQEPFDVEYRLKQRDGQYRWILDVGVPRRDADGTFAGFVGSALDITDRKKAEEVSGTLAHIHRLALMGELLTAIAHEVRQPLTAIMTNAAAAGRMLTRPDPPLDEVREIVHEIQKDDRRANDVLVRIRDFLQEREPGRETLDVNDFVREAFRFVHGDAMRRRVEITLDLSPGLPAIGGDRTQLQQVLLNLIINGMDAMDALPPTERHLVLRTARVNGDVRFSVIDRGSGIASEDMPRLFDQFFTTKHQAMGLGLSIAESIVSAHKGRIWVENNPGRGVTVHFAVPASTPG